MSLVYSKQYILQGLFCRSRSALVDTSIEVLTGSSFTKSASLLYRLIQQRLGRLQEIIYLAIQPHKDSGQ